MFIIQEDNAPDTYVKESYWYVMVDSENCITNDKYSKFSFIIDYHLEPRPNRVKFPDWI